MNNKQEIDNFLDAFKIMRSNLRSLTMDLFKDSEYTLPQLTVIAILAENGPLKATQISKMAGLANSTITGIIDRLEKKDVITRERQSTDRRLVLIKLNPGKEQIYQETRKIREDYFYDKLKELDNNKLKEMTDGLIELNNVICK